MHCAMYLGSDLPVCQWLAESWLGFDDLRQKRHPLALMQSQLVLQVYHPL